MIYNEALILVKIQRHERQFEYFYVHRSRNYSAAFYSRIYLADV